MEKNAVNAADSVARAVAIFDDEHQKVLTDRLGYQVSLTGILGKVLGQLLEQGKANYSDLIEVQILYSQISEGADSVLAIVTGLRPSVASKLPSPKAPLSLNSPILEQQSHPLAQD